MWQTPDAGRPRVFLSFAGDDRASAEQLRCDLYGRRIHAFVDKQDIAPGENFVLAVNEALTQSDYYVLLWSRSSAHRKWLEAEWSAAFSREMQERRSFLFIVRLDDTALPLLLAPRQYLDAFNDWDKMVNDLDAAWHRDRAVGGSVLPAPGLAAMHHDGVQRPAILLYVRNRDLSVAHVIVLPGESADRKIGDLVRGALELRDTVTMFNGAVGIRSSYQLKSAGESIPFDKTLAELRIADGTMIDLEVQVEFFSPEGTSSVVTLRQGESTGLSPAVTRSLIKSGFGHLTP